MTLALLAFCIKAVHGNDYDAKDAAHPCELLRLDGKDMTKPFISPRPTVITGLTKNWVAMESWRTASAFAERYGDHSGYARDHDHLEINDIDISIAKYLEPGNHTAQGSFAFFVNDYEDSRLLDAIRNDYYVPLPLTNLQQLRVFALEKRGAGVAFHRHEAAWQAQVAGEKSWFLISPEVDSPPLHSPCQHPGGVPPVAQQCVLQTGDVMYVPDNWWHATCTRSTEPSIAIGGVGSIEKWPVELRVAQSGYSPGLETEGLFERTEQLSQVLPATAGNIFMGGETPLFIAAAFGHVAMVKELLDKRADPNAVRRDGRTAVHEAARRGSVDILELLHKAGGRLETRDAGGSSASHHAVGERGEPAVVEYLIGQRASVNEQRGDGQTLLHVACTGHRDNVPLFKMLLKSGATTSLRDTHGREPLALCATTGHAKGVGLLLKLGADVAATSAEGKDALTLSLEGKAADGVVTRLLAARAIPEISHLTRAVRIGALLAAKALVAAGVRPSGAIVHEAATGGHVDILRWLLSDLHISPSEKEEDGGAQPVHIAALAGHSAAIHVLLHSGAKATATDGSGLSPLHYAAVSGNRTLLIRKHAVVARLIESAGPRLWSNVDKTGTSPLHYAAAAGDVDLVKWMVDQEGVEADALDRDGKSPADHAETVGQKDLASFIRMHTARASQDTADREEL